jgi:UPF0755 protein
MTLRAVKLLMLLALSTGAGFLAWFFWFSAAPLKLAVSPLDFHVPAGSSLRGVSQLLPAAGVGIAPWQFELLARWKGRDAQIKAGSYEIERGVTPAALLDKLTRGDVSQSEVAFIEGWTFRQMRETLEKHPYLIHESSGLSDAEILARIGATEKSPEGLFFPDTYLFSKNSSDLDLLRRAYRAMREALQQEWERRDPAVPYASPYEALIVASLVEKETGTAADRPLVASVFVNRLTNYMPLQTDPSVIYGLGERFDGNLRKSDLTRDTAYNTYTRPGLPPTPIAMPGRASLQAALRPAESDHLYFVARGDGSSQFSRTLEEHNRAVNRYQKRRLN